MPIVAMFLVAAGLQVAGLFWDRQLVPYAGTGAMAALLLFALASPVRATQRRWARWAGLGGLSMLTVTAGLVDAHTGGYGWPAEFATGYGFFAMAEAVLLPVALAALGVGILGHAGRVPLWGRLPAALFGILVIASAGDESAGFSSESFGDDVALVLPVVIAAALGIAIGVTTARGRLRFGHAVGALLTVTALAVSTVLIAHDDVDEQLGEPDVNAVTLWRFERALSSEPPASMSVIQSSGIFIDPYSRLPGWTARPAPPPPDPVDIAAVSGPPTWSTDLWNDDADWSRAMPALLATLLLLTLTILVTSMFPAALPPRRSWTYQRPFLT